MRGVQHFDPPRPWIARTHHTLDEAAHVELALAAELTMTDRLLVQGHAGRRLQVPVVELDAGQKARRDRGDALVRDAELDDVPEVDADAAVRLIRAFDHRERVLERVDHREWHHLEADARAVSGGIATGESKKSPTLTWRAPSSPAASSIIRRSTSDAVRRSPGGRNQSVRNSSSRWRMPLSARIRRISARLCRSLRCTRSACQIPRPVKPAFDAASARSRRPNGLHSWSVCGSAPPQLVQ